MTGGPTLVFFCGKMAAGKSTLARQLAGQHQAMLLGQDAWLQRLYPGEVTDLAAYVRCAARIGEIVQPLVCELLTRGLSVVLDFPANTRTQRAWFRKILEAVPVRHELHFIDVTDEVCKRQLHQRSAGLGAQARWTSEADFDAVSAYFQAPATEEGFNVILHRRP